MNEKSVKINVLLNLLKNFTTLLFPIISFSYAARILNPEGVGRVTYARVITNYMVLIASLGVNLYGVREIAKIRNNKERRTKATQEIIFINFSLTILCFVLFLLIINFIPSLNDKKEILYVFSLILLFKPIGLEWFFSALEDYVYITKRTLVTQFASLILMFILVQTSNDTSYYAIVLTLSEVGANIFNIIYAQKFLEHKIYEKYEIRKHIKPMLFFFGTVISAQIYSDVDALMLGIMSGDFAVGLYSAATKLSSAFMNLLTSICVVAFARITYYKSSIENSDEDFAKKTFNYLMLLSIPITIGLEMIGKEAILLFCGADYLLATTTMQIITPSILIYSLVIFIYYLILNPSGREKTVFIITALGAVVNLIGNMLLIPFFHEKGAAFSTLFTKLLMLVVCVLVTKKQFKYKDVLNYIWQYVTGAIGIILICITVKYIVKNVIICCLLSIILSGSIYFVFLILLHNPYMMQLLAFIFDKAQNIYNQIKNHLWN